MVGNRYTRLVVVQEVENSRSYHHRWECLCDCGNIKQVRGDHLTTGKTKSCGCLSRENSTTHGMWGQPVYKTWAGMIKRCTNQNSAAYIHYGGRGISVCDEWLVFENFFHDMGIRPDGTSLERIDNSKGYSRANCTWATHTEQMRNTRRNRYVTYKGETLTVSAWAERIGVDRSVMGWRLFKQKWPIEKALFYLPVRPDMTRRGNGKDDRYKELI